MRFDRDYSTAAMFVMAFVVIAVIAAIVADKAVTERQNSLAQPFTSIQTYHGRVQTYRQCIDGNLYLIVVGSTGIAVTAIPPVPRPCASLTPEAQ